jgi:hypothetical protein
MRKMATQPFTASRAMSRDSSSRSQISSKEKKELYWQLTSSIEKNMYSGFTMRPKLPRKNTK